jgi:hypothetical protein
MELGWLLYSSRQQDEKRLSQLLSKLTGGKIGARWQLIRMNTNVRRVTEPAENSRRQEVRAVHLECDTQAAQYVKHKVAHVIKLLISR